MKNNSTTRFLGIIFVSLIAFAMPSAVCSAEDTTEEWSRKGKSEIYLLGQYMGGDTTQTTSTPYYISSKQKGKIEIEVDDTTVFGFGIGNNIIDHLNLNLDMFFGSADITGTLGKSTVKDNATLVGLDLNLDFNILKSRFTPLVTGGIGLIAFSGDIQGWKYDETDFSYNLGGGFRWDATDHFLIKAIYKATWTKMEDTDKSILLDGVTVSIGYIF